MHNGKRNIRGWVIWIVSLLMVFVVLPYALWSGHKDYKNIATRGKTGEGKVIEVKGLKEEITTIEYFVNDQRFVVVRDAPRGYKKAVGDHVKLRYDSLDFETVLVLW